MYKLYITSNNRADIELIDMSFDDATRIAQSRVIADKSIVKIDLLKRHTRVSTIFDAMNPQTDA